MRFLEKAFVVLTACLLLAGCKTETARVTQPVSSEVVIDYASAIWFKTISYKIVAAGNGLIQAQAEIKNVDSTAHPVRYRSEWYSEGGDQVGESNWEMRMARPDETVLISVMAYHPSARKVKLYVK